MVHKHDARQEHAQLDAPPSPQNARDPAPSDLSGFGIRLMDLLAPARFSRTVASKHRPCPIPSASWSTDVTKPPPPACGSRSCTCRELAIAGVLSLRVLLPIVRWPVCHAFVVSLESSTVQIEGPEDLPTITTHSRFAYSMSNQQHPDDHFHYGCFPRPNRRGTPTGGNPTNNNNNNGSRRGLHFGHGLFSFGTPYTQDPLQARSDPTIAPYGQATGWPVNQSQAHQQGVPFSSDPRFQTQTPYGSYPSRSSPSMIGNPQDSRTLPPLNMPPSQVHPHLPMTAPGQVRSPTGGYTSYAPFPQQHQQPNPYGYSGAPDPRQLPPSIPTMPQYDQPSGLTQRRGSLVDRSARPVVGHGASPYPRVPSVVPPSPYLPDPPQQEPVKKKRKRADAEQLKVLNETYNRTAFPSTEERNELAKKLGMSSRSVQIWFALSLRCIVQRASTD
ncbi:hypothetical protein NUW54_g5426 [Trametes sanguinea]|uniref:Uncharacterized protein n=1 Tax=Trametes sanguinea TaxID=158606 RepID=A0ACC1PWZ9_9APHY|nr:hypothetical protein NUW54_g5426 [Trametes sanguinea]